jgi:hypothetical protein|tara:strand:+ start:6565 stop:6969 length:405 start_codon:yes stop_codon:yes gene_type:complete
MGNKIDIRDLVEIKLRDDEDFLKIKETLTRIGISSRKENKLYQSCHILHKKGRYYIVHFKELFLLDGLDSDMDETDLGRRNTIVNLLVEWGLCDLVDENQTKEPTISLGQLKIISHKEKSEWELCPKYHIGKKY